MPHHLLGISEVSALLGVSRQRVDQLAAAHPDFPRPEAALATGRIWSRAAVESWAEGHGERRPGRRPEQIERLTPRARHAIALAEAEARSLNHNYMGCEHLLLGLAAESEGVAARALAGFGLRADEARVELGRLLAQGRATVGDASLPFTPRLRRALREAESAARELAHNYLGTEHLLLGILREGENVGCRVLRSAGIDLFALRLRVLEVMGFPQPAAGSPGSFTQAAAGASSETSVHALHRIEQLLEGIEGRLERLERRLP